MVNIIVLIVAVLMGLAGSVNAAGFRLADQDAKATGMANAFTSVADNASAVWYNPAAITDLEGNNVSLGTILVMPTMEHKNTSGTTDKIEEKTHIPPHFYTTFKKSDRLSFGIGVNAPFGLSTEWDKATANTRFVATKSEVQAVNYNLNAAAKMSEKLSFAIGASYVAVEATLNKMANSFAPTVPANLEGDGSGMGYNAAVMYKYNDKMKFGVNYRSKVKATLKGDLTTTAVTPVKADLTLPDMLQVGVSHQCTPKWLFAVEADYTNWTTYRNIIIKKQSDGSVVSTDIKNWKSTWAFRLGSEYKYSDTLKFRAGSFYDMNPVKEERFETRVPDTDRVAFSVGAGWTRGNLTVDVAYMYLMFIERKIDGSLQDSATTGGTTVLDGKYNSKAHLPGITVGYKF